MVRQAEDDEAHDDTTSGDGDLLPVEGEDLQLGRQVDLAHDDAVGHGEHGGGEVEHRAHPGGDQVVAGLLGTLGGGGDDADGQAVVGDERGQVAHRAHPLAGDPLADDVRVAVEQRDDPEAPLGEAAVGGQRPAQVAHPDDGDRPVLGEAEGRGDLGGEPLDVVADAAHPVGAQVREVLAQHRRADPGGGGELLGADRGDALTGQRRSAPAGSRGDGPPTPRGCPGGRSLRRRTQAVTDSFRGPAGPVKGRRSRAAACRPAGEDASVRSCERPHKVAPDPVRRLTPTVCYKRGQPLGGGTARAARSRASSTRQ